MPVVRDLPPVNGLTEQQQRGWSCIWCGTSLTVGADIDLGEQRARPTAGAAYSWFPRACSDTRACADRERGANAVSAGIIRDQQAAHVLDTEVWAGPCCATTLGRTDRDDAN